MAGRARPSPLMLRAQAQPIYVRGRRPLAPQRVPLNKAVRSGEPPKPKEDLHALLCMPGPVLPAP